MLEYIMSDTLIAVMCCLIAMYFVLCAGYLVYSEIYERSRRMRRDKLDARRYRALRKRAVNELHEAEKEKSTCSAGTETSR